MKPVATIQQMKECDNSTIVEIGLPGMVLMENASRAAAERAERMLEGDVSGKKVLCLCGKGNNGGDGLAVARHLASRGAEATVYLFCKPESLNGDAANNRDLWLQTGGNIHVAESIEDLKGVNFSADLIIDALLGTGFTPPANELYLQVFSYINASGSPVLAVDIPSGVSGDTGDILGTAVEADSTVTFGILKPGLLLSPGRDYSGTVTVADIGIPAQVVSKQDIKLFQIEVEDVRSILPTLPPSAHKGDAGFVYILAGSPGLTGAATLAADAAMRSGAGLVTVGVPKSLNFILECKLTEAMSEPLSETASGGLSTAGFGKILPRLEWADAVAFGPGVGKDAETGELLELILGTIDKPLVIDADGLNLLAGKPELLGRLPGKTILTPHRGEFSRLTGCPVQEIAQRSLDLIREYSHQWNVVIMLKGSPSLTAAPDGRVFINSTGNQGMATGGSGDVLTGIITALLAAGLPPLEAAWAGGFIHGYAGDLARDELGIRGMIAGDLISYLPATFRTIT